MSKLATYLNEHIIGNVFDRPSLCESYSRDRSILKITPRLVALPASTDDICEILRFATQLAMRDFELPVTVRGSGTDKTGASVGAGLVLSTKRLNQIEEIDIRGRLVRVQAGVTLGQLNGALALQGLCLPIDYDPRATIGGLIANCPNDDASDRYGGIFRYIDRAEVVLASGERLHLAPSSIHSATAKMQTATTEGILYKQIDQLLDKYADIVLDRSMQPFDAAGYANVTQVRTNSSFNLLPLLFTSQGTLAVITDVILRVIPIPPPPHRLLVSFHDLKVAQRFLNYVCDLEPTTLKIFDLRIIDDADKHGKKPPFFVRKIGKGLLVEIKFNYRRPKLAAKLKKCFDALPEGTLYLDETPENLSTFETIDSAVLSFLNDDTRGERTPVLDDVFIPSVHFSDYLQGLNNLERELDLSLPIYGSFITSNYSVRPDIECTHAAGRKLMVNFLKRYSELVHSCQGSLTGNTPEGQVKALIASKTLGVGERQLYSGIKEIFDPNNILNPRVKLGADVRSTIRHLCTKPRGGIIEP